MLSGGGGFFGGGSCRCGFGFHVIVFMVLSVSLQPFTDSLDSGRMQRDLNMLMHPLPWQALPVVFSCLQEGAPGHNWRSLMLRDPWNVVMSVLEAENVIAKVQSVFPHAVGVPQDICSPHSDTCVPLCSHITPFGLKGGLNQTPFGFKGGF